MPFHALSSFNDVMTFSFFSFLSPSPSVFSFCLVRDFLAWVQDGRTDQDICGKIRLFCCCFRPPDSFSLVLYRVYLFFLSCRFALSSFLPPSPLELDDGRYTTNHSTTAVQSELFVCCQCWLWSVRGGCAHQEASSHLSPAARIVLLQTTFSQW